MSKNPSGFSESAEEDIKRVKEFQATLDKFATEIAPELAKKVILTSEYAKYNTLDDKDREEFDRKYKDFLTPEQANEVATKFLATLHDFEVVANNYSPKDQAEILKKQMEFFVDGLIGKEDQSKSIGSFPKDKINKAKEIIKKIEPADEADLASKDQSIAQVYQQELPKYFDTAIKALEARQIEYGKQVAADKNHIREDIEDSISRNLRTEIITELRENVSPGEVAEAFLQAVTNFSEAHAAEALTYEQEKEFIVNLRDKKEDLIKNLSITNVDDLTRIDKMLSLCENRLAKKRFVRSNKVILDPSSVELFDKFLEDSFQLAIDPNLESQKNQELMSNLLWDKIQEDYASQGVQLTAEDKKFMQDISFVLHPPKGEPRTAALRGFIGSPSRDMPSYSDNFKLDLVRLVANKTGKIPGQIMAQTPDDTPEREKIIKDTALDHVTKALDYVTKSLSAANFKKLDKYQKQDVKSELEKLANKYGAEYFFNNSKAIAAEYSKAFVGGRLKRFSRWIRRSRDAQFSEKDFAKAAAKLDTELKKSEAYQTHVGRQVQKSFRQMNEREQNIFTEGLLKEIGELAMKEPSNKYLEAVFADITRNINQNMPNAEKIQKNRQYIRTLLEAPMPNGAQSGAEYFAGKLGDKLVAMSRDPATGLIESRMQYDKNFKSNDFKLQLQDFAKKQNLIEGKKQEKEFLKSIFKDPKNLIALREANKLDFDKLLFRQAGIDSSIDDKEISAGDVRLKQVDDINDKATIISSFDAAQMQKNISISANASSGGNQQSDIEANSVGNQSAESLIAPSPKNSAFENPLSEKKVKKNIKKVVAGMQSRINTNKNQTNKNFSSRNFPAKNKKTAIRGS